jgi:proteasome assembly chaperone (PAC2) family protein
MGIRIFKEPDVREPVLIACWPGIGNIGLLAVDTLRKELGAEEFGDIEPWDFFYPNKLVIEKDELVELGFPTNKFYYKKTENKDLLFFIGEEQPAWGGRAYAEGSKAYQMANMVLDTALKFGCRRVYTSGAAVASTHHTLMPRVWAVPNSRELIPEIKKYKNTVLMSAIEGRAGQGNISGLNGLLIGVARKRGIEAMCIMGEIPVYLQGFPLMYPKASKAILEVLTTALQVTIDMRTISELAVRNEMEIDRLYDKLPPEAKDQLDKLKEVTYEKKTEAGIITEEDKKKILENIDKFFQKGNEEDEN